jgi:hypothetical protein
VPARHFVRSAVGVRALLCAIVVICGISADPVAAQAPETPPAPCDTMPAARRFDFWIGDWDVYDPAGQLAGTNSIQKIIRGCALLENWEGSRGGSGKSLNWYNVPAGYWQQTWIASGATHQEFREGRLDGSTLRFYGERTTPQGAKLNLRLSFTPLGPNRVRQHAENSADGGATWTTDYDFLYLRRGSGETP